MLFLRVLVFVLGFSLPLAASFSAIRTVVLPRSARDRITSGVFRLSRKVFNKIARRYSTYRGRDSIMAYYAPVTLLILQISWLTLSMLGFSAIFWALGVDDLFTAFQTSGSSLLTLGFASVKDLPQTVAAFAEAMLGLILVALLIAYLPTMYAAFSKREQAVTMLEVRAGSPPSAVEMLSRFHRLRRLELLNELWTQWEVWFVELGESHTSLPALNFFRSPQPQHSWVTASGAVLDAAALINAAVAVPHDAQADLCIRAGYLALRRICDFFLIPYNPDPSPLDNISITRLEFEEALDRLQEGGVPLVPDRDQAWRDFKGWRVNYDGPLLAMAAITMAPEAPWSSDRSFRSAPTNRLVGLKKPKA